MFTSLITKIFARNGHCCVVHVIDSCGGDVINLLLLLASNHTHVNQMLQLTDWLICTCQQEFLVLHEEDRLHISDGYLSFLRNQVSKHI